MNLISLSPNTQQNTIEEKESVLSAFRVKKEDKKEITEGMSPKEIADIVSNHLMEIINKQFEKGKSNFLNKK